MGPNLIRLFDFYLAAMFLLGTARRIEQYVSIGTLVVSAPARWPRLLQVMKQHRAIFFTWSTLRPALLALTLVVVQTIASRLIWPQADLRAADLLAHWYVVPVLVLTFLPMIGLDAYFLIRVSRIDRHQMGEYLDYAERWLTGWKAPVLRFVTLGFFDPRRVVSAEVQKALATISGLININLYWMSLQIGLRVLFGLALWLTWALFGEHS